MDASSINKGDFKNWGPYVSYGRDAAHEMAIVWKSPEYKHSLLFQYGKDPENLKKIEEKWKTPSKIHMVKLKDLEPDTTYYYKIPRKGDENKIYSFKTAPTADKCKRIKFTVVGDIHANPNEDVSTVFNAMMKYTPDHDFSITVGDSINDGNDPSHWNSYFYDLREYLPLKPQMNATGNHDTEHSENKYSRFLSAFPHHPYEDPEKGAYYLFEYGNAVFFFIDSNNAGQWEPTPSDEQYDWLEENLEKYAKKDKWIFLFMHHQIFSTGDFSIPRIMHDLWRPLCQEYHVDAVFYGHDHHYECFWVDRDMDYGGTLYFVAGAGGTQNRIDHSIMGDRDGKTKYVWPGRILNVRKHGVPPETPNITLRAKDFRDDELVRTSQLLGVLEPSYVYVSVNGDEAEFKAIGWHGEIYHHFKIKRAGAGRKFEENFELKVIEY